MKTRYTDEQLRNADDWLLESIATLAPSKSMGGYVEFSANGETVRLTYADRLACEAELRRRKSKAKGGRK